ncbi:MAG: indolepyruvate oxidoreductase subunit beta [Clostridiales Family XIII bacterium]|jgi:indolepyruvate ferredoxin oxidoreductase beta subunit|nr:indolepyruvate oxidoreductase subunit beta [Clostridiales Family XIII bacterium]
MNSDSVTAILLVGVGGQGTILASQILSEGFVRAGYDVKMSEIHGMSQRGGSVSTQIRYGTKVYSPIIGRGEADVIVAFEKMEALRWIEYLKPDGKMIINDYEIPSVPILTGAEQYPEGILGDLAARADVSVLRAADIADEVGNARVMNIVLLGAAVKALTAAQPETMAGIVWEEIIRATVKPAFIDVNIKAFAAGQAAG